MYSKNSAQAQTWRVVEIQVEEDQEELVSWLMIGQGSRGCLVTLSGDRLVSVGATFDGSSEEAFLEKLKGVLKAYGFNRELSSLRLSTIAEEDWLARWKEGFVPFELGNKFLICPTWHRASVDAGRLSRHVIFIEPGMAFGTGLHATTQYCLKALERMEPPEDILDVGTGSGILAIAAAKVFADAGVAAVDINPTCIKAARENCQLNGVTQRVFLAEGSTENFDNQAFDCILANLSCEDIKGLLLEFLRLLRPQGRIICAGVLADRGPFLEEAIRGYPLSAIEQEVSGEWLGITLQRIGVLLSPAKRGG